MPDLDLDGRTVNDIHSRLNPTRVRRMVEVQSIPEIAEELDLARRQELPICVGGGWHAMGAQQFATGAVLLDTRRLDRVLSFDPDAGTVEVEAGIQWPELIAWLLAAQSGRAEQWSIAQKQTGADRLSLGGAVSANVHGRGLRMAPLVADVEALTIIDVEGTVRRVSRTRNPELFRLVVGGYGLFGIIGAVQLRLVSRRKLRRVVEILPIEELVEALEARIASGDLYGDFQFAIDPRSPDFLRLGVCATYRPVDPETPLPRHPRVLSAAEWRELIWLAHVDRGEAFHRYVAHYRATHGQVYWSDTHQLALYLDDYHRELDRRLGATHPGSEVITELLVPRDRLTDFMAEARELLPALMAEPVYGTVRLIERDDESYLPWARERFACVILNLHVEHTPAGQARAATAFRWLIDMAAARGGSYYLTYHRYAGLDQILTCHPRFREWMRLKRRYDPDERLQSDWYRHHRRLLGDG